MLQREELCSQVPRHPTYKQTPKKAKKQTYSAPVTLTCAQAQRRGGAWCPRIYNGAHDA